MIRSLVILALLATASATGARDGPAVWGDLCEECHGDHERFAVKYLWNLDGQLQGQHHIDNMDQFLGNHYVPGHELATIRQMLLAGANTPARFGTECGECHGELESFVNTSLWVGKASISGMESGADAADYLQTHRDLTPQDVNFYLKLFFRVAGKSVPSELISTEPGLAFP